MRHGRAKAARKTLQYFKRVTGLTAPYRVLLDATIVATLFQQNVFPLRERIDKVLQTFGNGNTQNNMYCITKSAVEELEMIHQGLQSKQHPKAEVFAQALEWIRNECKVLEINTASPGNDKETEEEGSESSSSKDAPKAQTKKKHATKRSAPEWTKAQKDFISCIEQDGRPFVVGSQDEILLDKLRTMGTVPIVRLANQSVLLLEHPSKQSQQQSKGDERRKWKHNLAETEKALVNLVKKEKRDQRKVESRPTERFKTKAKGPNPLSCKRKSSSTDGGKESASSKRRKRTKK
jgi:rRNA-processing protein FCF1